MWVMKAMQVGLLRVKWIWNNKNEIRQNTDKKKFNYEKFNLI